MSSSRGRSEARSCRRVLSSRSFRRRVDSGKTTAASSGVRSRARGFAGNDVPAAATDSVDRGRLDSVTLSIWPCVFGDGSARQRPGVTRVSNADTSDERRKWRAFSKTPLAEKFGTRARVFGAACASAYLRAARSTDLPGLRRSCSRREGIAISRRGRGWNGRKADPRR